MVELVRRWYLVKWGEKFLRGHTALYICTYILGLPYYLCDTGRRAACANSATTAAAGMIAGLGDSAVSAYRAVCQLKQGKTRARTPYSVDPLKIGKIVSQDDGGLKSGVKRNSLTSSSGRSSSIGWVERLYPRISVDRQLNWIGDLTTTIGHMPQPRKNNS